VLLKCGIDLAKDIVMNAQKLQNHISCLRLIIESYHDKNCAWCKLARIELEASLLDLENIMIQSETKVQKIVRFFKRIRLYVRGLFNN
jgi:hypothetical protein